MQQNQKSILLMALLFAVPLFSYSQLFVGFEIGPSGAKYKQSLGFANDAFETKSLTGLTAGFNVGMHLINRGVAISIAPSFARNGSVLETVENFEYVTNEGITSLGFFTITEQLNTVNIPIMARTQFGNRFGVSVAIGLGYQLRLSGRAEAVQNDLIAGNSALLEEYDIEFGSRISPYKSGDLQFVFAPGIYYDLDIDGVWRLNLTMNLTSGLNEMINPTYRELTGILGQQKQQATALKLGIEFCPWCYD